MSAILQPVSPLTPVSSIPHGPSDRQTGVKAVRNPAAARVTGASRRHSVEKWIGAIIIVGFIMLFAFLTYECGRALNPLNRQQANTQWVNLLIHNFNPNTPVTPFNGNQWAQF
jgi:hypothetical protein